MLMESFTLCLNWTWKLYVSGVLMLKMALRTHHMHGLRPSLLFQLPSIKKYLAILPVSASRKTFHFGNVHGDSQAGNVSKTTSYYCHKLWIKKKQNKQLNNCLNCYTYLLNYCQPYSFNIDCFSASELNLIRKVLIPLWLSVWLWLSSALTIVHSSVINPFIVYIKTCFQHLLIGLQTLLSLAYSWNT